MVSFREQLFNEWVCPQAGESGVVVLRPEALAADSESEEEDARPPSPCSVRFVNDNVLINGRSSMAARLTARDRAARVSDEPPHSLLYITDALQALGRAQRRA